MINPLSARITLPTYNMKTTSQVLQNKNNTGKDSFTFSANLNSEVQAEVKSSATILELLFGNVTKKNKKPKAEHYNRYEAELYAKPRNEEELRQFIINYQPQLKL